MTHEEKEQLQDRFGSALRNMVEVYTQPLEQKIEALEQKTEALEQRIATLEHRAGPVTTQEMMADGNSHVLGIRSTTR